jgi:hypothetical protein
VPVDSRWENARACALKLAIALVGVKDLRGEQDDRREIGKGVKPGPGADLLVR